MYKHTKKESFLKVLSIEVIKVQGNLKRKVNLGDVMGKNIYAILNSYIED